MMSLHHTVRQLYFLRRSILLMRIWSESRALTWRLLSRGFMVTWVFDPHSIPVCGWFRNNNGPSEISMIPHPPANQPAIHSFMCILRFCCNIRSTFLLIFPIFVFFLFSRGRGGEVFGECRLLGKSLVSGLQTEVGWGWIGIIGMTEEWHCGDSENGIKGLTVNVEAEGIGGREKKGNRFWYTIISVYLSIHDPLPFPSPAKREARSEMKWYPG